MKVYVPKNKKGVEEFDCLVEEETSNLKIVQFTPEDYFYLNKIKYLDSLNVECGCIIDLYEDDIIPLEKLNNAIEITEILIKYINEERFTKLANQMIECFKLAIESKTFVDVYCYGNPKSHLYIKNK